MPAANEKGHQPTYCCCSSSWPYQPLQMLCVQII